MPTEQPGHSGYGWPHCLHNALRSARVSVGRHHGTVGETLIELEHELIEDGFDDTTHIRAMTEQAVMPGKGWLVRTTHDARRTTLYTPHHITAGVVFVPATEGAGEGLLEPIGP